MFWDDYDSCNLFLEFWVNIKNQFYYQHTAFNAYNCSPKEFKVQKVAEKITRHMSTKIDNPIISIIRMYVQISSTMGGGQHKGPSTSGRHSHLLQTRIDAIPLDQILRVKESSSSSVFFFSGYLDPIFIDRFFFGRTVH